MTQNTAASPVTTTCLGFTAPIDAVVLGARSGIGEAFLNELSAMSQVRTIYGTSRAAHWAQLESTSTKIRRCEVDIVDETSVKAFAERLKTDDCRPNLVINCTGLLHDAEVQPERSWHHLSMMEMQRTFAVNTFGVGLLIRYLLPTMKTGERSIFASLSARVGSIEDTRLGGWSSYRASKAAQNMLVKTAAIEARLKAPGLICVQLHPGTVSSELSAPFVGRLPERHAVFTPAFSCERLCAVLEGLDVQDSGRFYAWDGQSVAW